MGRMSVAAGAMGAFVGFVSSRRREKPRREPPGGRFWQFCQFAPEQETRAASSRVGLLSVLSVPERKYVRAHRTG